MDNLFFMALVSALILVGFIWAAYWLDNWTIRARARR
jgi:hypothetical protein